MKTIKGIVLISTLLFATVSFARNSKAYVNVDFGVAQSFIPEANTSTYEEVRVGYQYKDSLLGVSYSKYPVHLWEVTDWVGESVPRDVYYSSNTFGVFYKQSFSYLSQSFQGDAYVTPTVEVAVKKHDPNLNDTENGFEFDVFVGVNVQAFRYLVLSADLGGRYLFTKNEDARKNFAGVFKLGVGASF